MKKVNRRKKALKYFMCQRHDLRSLFRYFQHMSVILVKQTFFLFIFLTQTVLEIFFKEEKGMKFLYLTFMNICDFNIKKITLKHEI